jgi:hypothetical protein
MFGSLMTNSTNSVALQRPLGTTSSVNSGTTSVSKRSKSHRSHRRMFVTPMTTNTIGYECRAAKIPPATAGNHAMPTCLLASSAIVTECAHRAAEQTGDTDFHYVSSPDLRRRFAQHLLVDHSMNPQVVMTVGGWNSFQAIELYLNAPSPEVVNEAFDDAGLA